MILSSLDGVECKHEPFRPRIGDEGDVLMIGRDLIESDLPIYGHSSHLVMCCLEELVHLVQCKVVCIHRNREETIDSWMRHNGCVSGFVRNPPERIHSMCSCYPRFDTDDPRESFGLWWDYCEAKMEALPGAHHMDISELNSGYTLDLMADYLEIPSPREWPSIRKWDVRWGANIEELPQGIEI
jgi:hypothetical protein